MITGIVTHEGEPIVQLSVASQEWSALIDTGFNGDLELPEALRQQVNAQYRGTVQSLLARGQRIEETVYLVDFPFDGERVLAEATFGDSPVILLGTHLMRRY